MTNLSRRSFLAAAGLTGAASVVRAGDRQQPDAGQRAWPGDSHRGPVCVASSNGEAATARAFELMMGGQDPVDAVVAGVKINEDDPEDMSVGYGGLPNEDGVVQLDASVMHGPTHKAGSVAAIEGIRNPASVALLVLKRTDHVMLVGEGAKRFAIEYGFEEQDMLAPAARQAWLKWRENLNPEDDRLDWDQMDFEAPLPPVAVKDPIAFTYGTINCSAVNTAGNLASCTTTSGLSYKIPGRIGDSPIVGAGMYVDNAVGAAGATGRGEAVIVNCGAYAIVSEMERGATPTRACLTVMARIASHTREKRLLDADGRPNFNVALYAVRKDGAYGGAVMRGGARFAVTDERGTRLETLAPLFE
ncbi:MAG: N(4)-(beta-N-acetylglucosaminyl)-L-asparaginase [Phycisphaeraceae bacterium]|nr:N(4)-(beta-N-acetylglucosaminyl)-L-asparaginase [Phycisphaeraceae bacterium]